MNTPCVHVAVQTESKVGGPDNSPPLGLPIIGGGISPPPHIPNSAYG